MLHKIALKNKEYHLVEQVEKIIIQEYTEQFVY